jgi:hypothetical protein
VVRGAEGLLQKVLEQEKGLRGSSPLVVQRVCRRWGLPRGVWRRAIAPSLMGG